MTTIYDSLLALTKSLAEQAEAAGETRTAKFGDGTWKTIVRGGEVVGRYRVMGIEISVTPAKQLKAKKRKKKETQK